MLPIIWLEPVSFQVHIDISTWQLRNPLIVLLRNWIFYVQVVILRVFYTHRDRKEEKKRCVVYFTRCACVIRFCSTWVQTTSYPEKDPPHSSILLSGCRLLSAPVENFDWCRCVRFFPRRTNCLPIPPLPCYHSTKLLAVALRAPRPAEHDK